MPTGHHLKLTGAIVRLPGEPPNDERPSTQPVEYPRYLISTLDLQDILDALREDGG